MNRVVVTKPILWTSDYARAASTGIHPVLASIFGLVAMQVCAVADATDEEILAVCNRENPSGTENGWSEVVRVADESSPFKNSNKLPVQCRDHPDRLHFIVLC